MTIIKGETETSDRFYHSLIYTYYYLEVPTTYTSF